MSLLVVDVDQQLLERFRRFAANKHGRLYGVLKPEVQAALEEHMRIDSGEADRCEEI